MQIPPMFTTRGDVPGIGWKIVKAQIDTIVNRYAEPPYCVLFSTDALETKMWDLPGGTNVFIINLPYFLDCPSKIATKEPMLAALREAFPYMNIDFMCDNQYIFGDMNFPLDTELPPLTDKLGLLLSWEEWNSGGNCMIWSHEFADGKSIHVTDECFILSSLSANAHLDGDGSDYLLPPVFFDDDCEETDWQPIAFKLVPYLGQEIADATAKDIAFIVNNWNL